MMKTKEISKKHGGRRLDAQKNNRLKEEDD